MKHKILIVDDEVSLARAMMKILERDGHAVYLSHSREEAVEELDRQEFDLVFADILLGADSGIDVLQEIKARGMICPVIMITGAPSIDTAAEAVRLGAFDYIPKPFKMESLSRVTSVALRHKDLEDRYVRSRQNLEAIFGSVKDAILMVDENLNLIEFNQAAEDMFGLPRDAVGRPFQDMLVICSKRLIDALEMTLIGRESVEIPHFECKGSRNLNRVFAISTHPLIHGAKGPHGAVMVVRDETRLARLESDLKEREGFYSIIGKSESMQRLYELIKELADIDTTVLISGESGTGKELVAEALHFMGKRATKNLVKVNCSAISEQLLESELFGHVKGAFTGAISDRVGRFELAHGGTIFLDEIGDIPHATQVKLLRVLQNKEIERVGSTSSVKTDVRVVAATNRRLHDLVKRGVFREDLYYRLKVFELHIPPLRERKEDIPLLVDHFVGRLNRKLGKNVATVSRDALKALMDHDWPGNVRELEHILEHSVVLSQGSMITEEDFPQDFLSKDGPVPLLEGRSEQPEREKIIDALTRSHGKKAPAARMLGISRQTLYEKLKKYQIEEPNH